MISNNLKKRLYTSIGLLVLIILMYNSNIILVFTLLVLSVISILEFFNIIKKIGKNFIYSSILSFIFLIYIFSFSFLFFLFSNFLHLKIILFTLVAVCWTWFCEKIDTGKISSIRSNFFILFVFETKDKKNPLKLIRGMG